MTKRQTTRSKGSSATQQTGSPWLLVPVVVGVALLNMGGGDPGGGMTCQGQEATHVFTTSVDQWFYGTAGDDVIVVVLGSGEASVDAGDGDDLICVRWGGGAYGSIFIYGGDGHDRIYGSDADEGFSGQGGNDSLFGGGGNDRLYGDAGSDYLHGQGGDDIISGSLGDDAMWGGDGDDSLNGYVGDDSMYGGAGDDVLTGGGDNDNMYGGDGNDRLEGDGGNDTLRGQGGSDLLYGGSGDDTLYSGDEAGGIVGGSGDDTGYPCGLTSVGSGTESVDWDDPNCTVEAAMPRSIRLAIDVCEPMPRGSGSYSAMSISFDGEEFFTPRGNQPVAAPQVQPGQLERYDFVWTGTLNDIRELTIRNIAGIVDPFCMARVRLGADVYTNGTWDWRWLFDTGSMELWLNSWMEGGETSVTWTLDELRGTNDWTKDNATLNAPEVVFTGVDYDYLTRFLGAIFDGVSPRLNPRVNDWVVITPGPASNQASVHVIATADVPFIIQENVDIWFDLTVSCEDNAILLVPSNFDVDLDGVASNLQQLAEQGLEALASDLSEMVGLPDGVSCGGLGLVPQFDQCGLWPGIGGGSRPPGPCK